MIGKTLGHYRVVQELGRGGMGEVYLADDLNLNRKVALKFLPDIFTGDPERMARFEREAKLLASLNHPNIAAIYGLEQAEGKRFLVLEYVDGETLAQRISKGPLPIEEALAICRQIADALEAAHEKGVIHRDLKPANAIITAGDKVKILDFGLAKALADETQSVDSSQSPTLTFVETMTRPGVILGTAAYMSPEQAKGKAVDKRADIWAFGCILYECLTGKRAFDGETVAETLAAVLTKEPEWKRIQENTRPILQRCFQRDPNLRYHSIMDARLDLEAPILYSSEMSIRGRRSHPWAIVCAALMFFIGIFVGLWLMKNSILNPNPMVTTIIKTDTNKMLAGLQTTEEDIQRPTRTAFAISHNGKFVVYSQIGENAGPQYNPRLYLRSLDQLEAKPIVGTEGGFNPFISPDDRWVGFTTEEPQRQLKKVPVEGGIPTILCDTDQIYGANWGPDNSIIFGREEGDGLSRISADGGAPEILTTPDLKRDESSHRLPFYLPGGKAVLFTILRHAWDRHPRIALLHLANHDWSVLLEDAADAKYVPTGHLVFLRQGTLMAVNFDLSGVKIKGQPMPLIQNVIQTFSDSSIFNSGAGQFSFSETGTLLYAAGGVAPDPKNSLLWVDQKGVEEPVSNLQFPFRNPHLSPDGRKIAYRSTGSDSGVWVYDLEKGTNYRLSSEPGNPIWTYDGKQVLFGQQKTALEADMFRRPYDGSSPMQLITKSQNHLRAASPLPDGKTFAGVEYLKETSMDIVLLDISSGNVKPFLNSEFREVCPEFSPDGRWIAYASNESGRREVYIRPYPAPAVKYQVSNAGGDQPLWARNGKQLFYRLVDQVWIVDVRTEGGLATSKPRLLFDKPGYQWDCAPMRCYDVSLDGQRLLMVKEEHGTHMPATEMILVQNWFESLERLVSTGKK